MICPKCKTKLDDNVKSCNNCGFNITSNTSQKSNSSSIISKLRIDSYSSFKKHWLISAFINIGYIILYLLTEFTLVEKSFISIITEKTSLGVEKSFMLNITERNSGVAKLLYGNHNTNFEKHEISIHLQKFILFLFLISCIVMLLQLLRNNNLKIGYSLPVQGAATLLFLHNISEYFEIAFNELEKTLIFSGIYLLIGLLLFSLSCVIIVKRIKRRITLKIGYVCLIQVITTLLLGYFAYKFFKTYNNFIKTDFTEDIGIILNIFGWLYLIANIAAIIHTGYVCSKAKSYYQNKSYYATNHKPFLVGALSKIDTKFSIDSYKKLKTHWIISVFANISCVVLFWFSKITVSYTQIGNGSISTVNKLFRIEDFFRGVYNIDMKGHYIGIIPTYAFILVLLIISLIFMIIPIIRREYLKLGHLGLTQIVSTFILLLDVVVYLKTLIEFVKLKDAYNIGISLDFIGWIYILVTIFSVIHICYMSLKIKACSPAYTH